MLSLHRLRITLPKSSPFREISQLSRSSLKVTYIVKFSSTSAGHVVTAVYFFNPNLATRTLPKLILLHIIEEERIVLVILLSGIRLWAIS